jgi:hypothetical protein
VVGGTIAIGSAEGLAAVQDLVEDGWIARWNPKAPDACAGDVLADSIPTVKDAFAKS